MRKANTVGEVPGIYGARSRLCDPKQGQLFDNYHKIDAEELLEMHGDKYIADFSALVKKGKTIDGDLNLVFKGLDRLNFRITNTYYRKKR
jgi:hypothetical protein